MEARFKNAQHKNILILTMGINKIFSEFSSNYEEAF